jgi:hypothetical protein
MTKRELLSGVDDIGADAFALLSVWLSVLFIDDNNNKIVRFLCVFLLLLPDPLYSSPITSLLGLFSVPSDEKKATDQKKDHGQRFKGF